MTLIQFISRSVLGAFKLSWDAFHIGHQIAILMFLALSFVERWQPRQGEKPEMVEVIALCAATAVFVIGCVVRAFSFYREEFQRRSELENYMVPTLEFSGIAPRGGIGHHRILIRNLSTAATYFKVRLIELRPCDGLILPITLESASNPNSNGHCEVEPNGQCSVFVAFENEGVLRLSSHQIGSPILRRGESYDLVICIYLDNQPGKPIYRRLYLDSRPSGSAVLSDGGQVIR